MRLPADGGDYRGTGRFQSQGSYGNGGAMRIAPVGLAYRHAGDDERRKPLKTRSFCTHVHPEAIDGALVQAKAVATAATANVAALDSDAMIQSLRAICRTEVMAAKLDALADSLRHNDGDVYVIGRVGNGIRASQRGGRVVAFCGTGRIPRSVSFGPWPLR